MALGLAVNDVIDQHLHLCMEVALTLIVDNDCLLRSLEGQTFTLGTRTDLSDIVQAQHHIL